MTFSADWLMSRSILIAGGWSFSATDLAPIEKAAAENSEVTVLSPPDFRATGFDSAQDLSTRFASAAQGRGYDLAIGWSMGGMLILEAVLQGRLDVGRLLLFSTCGRFLQADDYPDGVPAKIPRAMQRHLKKSPVECIRDFRQASAIPAPAINIQSVWTVEELDEGLSFLSKFDVRDRLGDISQPTSIIHGERDQIIRPGNSRFLNAQIPNSLLTLVPSAGHDFCIRSGQPRSQWIRQALQVDIV